VQYRTEPKASSQSELKDKYDTAEWKKTLNERVVSLHAAVRGEILSLLEDREHFTSNSRFIREWVLVDIQPCPSRLPRLKANWLSWWNGEPEASSWAVVIKGYTLDGDLKFPNRTKNPFRRPLPRDSVFQRSLRRDQFEPPLFTHARDRRYSLAPSRIGQEQELVGLTEYLGQDENQKKIEAILTEIGGVVRQSSSS
jgi:hypothetical protein